MWILAVKQYFISYSVVGISFLILMEYFLKHCNICYMKVVYFIFKVYFLLLFFVVDFLQILNEFIWMTLNMAILPINEKLINIHTIYGQ